MSQLGLNINLSQKLQTEILQALTDNQAVKLLQLMNIISSTNQLLDTAHMDRAVVNINSSIQNMSAAKSQEAEAKNPTTPPPAPQG